MLIRIAVEIRDAYGVGAIEKIDLCCLNYKRNILFVCFHEQQTHYMRCKVVRQTAT